MTRRKDGTLTLPVCSRCGINRRSWEAAMCRDCHMAERRAASQDPALAARRFWARVDASAGPDECWPWQGPVRSKGYGVWTLFTGPAARRVPQVASRIAWELAHGAIPDGLWVLHHCDNPPCVNPRHLFLGTHQDNEDDKTAKGRRPAGPTHWRSLRRATEHASA